MADARSETTIDDVRVPVTTWSFEKAVDCTGAHVHEYDYVLVPVTGGTLTAVSTTDYRVAAKHPAVQSSPIRDRSLVELRIVGDHGARWVGARPILLTCKGFHIAYSPEDQFFVLNATSR